MYALKPILDLNLQVDLPKCMYTLPNIQSHLFESGKDQPCSGTSDGLPSLSTVERRQDRILQQLEDLRSQVSHYRLSIGLSSVEAPKLSPGVTEVIGASQNRVIGKIEKLRETLSGTHRHIKSKETLSPGVTEICGAYQKKVISNIENLQQTLNGYRQHVRSKPSVQKQDIVVRASPKYPPYSLQLVLRLLEDHGLKVFTSSHIHSSVVQKLPGNLQDFFPEQEVKRSDADLCITLIWKEVGRDPEFVISPVAHSLVKGELNLLRYMSRTLPVLGYEAQATKAVSSDDLLDIIHSDIVWGNPKDRQLALKKIDQKLSKQKFLAGEKIGIEDMLLWSVLKHSGGPSAQSSTVKQWVSKCSPNGAAKSGKTCQLNDDATICSDEDKAKVFAFFERHGIQYSNVDHPEVFTVEAMMPYLKNVNGAIGKNLFLKDKKKNLYLLSALHDRQINLNEIGKSIGTRDLRFGDESVMLDAIGVKQGCVSAYALINDTSNKVKFVVDSALVDGTFSRVNFHPLVNTATTGISVEDFKKFIEATKHNYVTVKF